MLSSTIEAFMSFAYGCRNKFVISPSIHFLVLLQSIVIAIKRVHFLVKNILFKICIGIYENILPMPIERAQENMATTLSEGGLVLLSCIRTSGVVAFRYSDVKLVFVNLCITLVQNYFGFHSALNTTKDIES